MRAARARGRKVSLIASLAATICIVCAAIGDDSSFTAILTRFRFLSRDTVFAFQSSGCRGARLVRLTIRNHRQTLQTVSGSGSAGIACLTFLVADVVNFA